MILDDFVMLGKAVPETNSDGRQFVCTAGWSIELRQPVRIYPMAQADCPPRWSLSRVPVERNPQDSRPESWKIKGDRRPQAHRQINAVIEQVQDKITLAQQREIVRNLIVPSLKIANQRRLSLCVILPKAKPSITLQRGEEPETTPTLDVFRYTPSLPVIERFRWHPRLHFSDDDGIHNLMLRDWGCYELMRKQGDAAAGEIDEALHLSATSPLFCGNLNRYRNAWLVISVFSAKLYPQPEVSHHQLRLFEDGTVGPNI